MLIRRWRIECATQEGDCEECGWPLDMGDVALYVGADELGPYCCDACAKRGAERLAVE